MAADPAGGLPAFRALAAVDDGDVALDRPRERPEKKRLARLLVSAAARPAGCCSTGV
ncbi:hypothetical protein [Micromonospora humidisoli]|uniref:hypothetical protein n=1 Tax=Micromonospora sp. AKA109 TaxID=2733865 RepID=UPI00249049E6|nr:hypothetical protein [Micromonospora sp. AKA109]